ncbi:cupredoxin domain-containing protein [Oceanobacillus halophilus]|uniref:Cytochrome C oxidase subunit II n=1 Tax=Oceanobacillus halophilus TaxID=930130 RepID=A0A494ZW01_9BACI|nr:cupredoxin domain-containing protein [Oceanobacillus halophilus]RKQ30755.1 cytochrome C oxidase subunit II [Oceanobacillus halophilus]
MKKLIIASLFIALILLAACGGEGNDTSETANSTEEEATEQAEDSGSSEGTKEASNEVNVVATNFDFNQDEYVVNAGEEVTVSLTNEEGHHGISIDELGVNIEGEGEAVIVPEEPGEYKIYCNIFCGEGHAEMVATLVVQ